MAVLLLLLRSILCTLLFKSQFLYPDAWDQVLAYDLIKGSFVTQLALDQTHGRTSGRRQRRAMPAGGLDWSWRLSGPSLQHIQCLAQQGWLIDRLIGVRIEQVAVRND